MEDDDDVVLICQPVLPRERPGVRGSAIRECGDCHKPIWLAPSGQKIAKERNALLICMDCAYKQMQDEKDMTFMAPTPEQLQEIEKELRWHAARRFENSDKGLPS